MGVYGSLYGRTGLWLKPVGEAHSLYAFIRRSVSDREKNAQQRTMFSASRQSALYQLAIQYQSISFSLGVRFNRIPARPARIEYRHHTYTHSILPLPNPTSFPPTQNRSNTFGNPNPSYPSSVSVVNLTPFSNNAISNRGIAAAVPFNVWAKGNAEDDEEDGSVEGGR